MGDVGARCTSAGTSVTSVRSGVRRTARGDLVRRVTMRARTVRRDTAGKGSMAAAVTSEQGIQGSPEMVRPYYSISPRMLQLYDVQVIL